MTEPDHDPAAEPDDSTTADDRDLPRFALGEVLEAFKSGMHRADTRPMSELGGRTRLNWDSVTEGDDATPAESGARTSFQFDLGSALARLGDPAAGESETPEPTTSGPPTPASDRVETRPILAPSVEAAPAEAPNRPDPAPTDAAPADAAPADAAPAAAPEAVAPELADDEPPPLPVRRRKVPDAVAGPDRLAGRGGDATSPLTRAAEPAAAPPAASAPPASPAPAASAPAAPADLPVRDAAPAAPADLPVRGGGAAPASTDLPVRGGGAAPASTDLPVRGRDPRPPASTGTPPATDPGELPVRDRSDQRPAAAAPAAPAARPDPAPARRAEPPASPGEPTARSRARSWARKSVFDSAAAAPHLPSSPSAPPQYHVHQPSAPTPMSAAGMPTLPSAPAAAPPPMVAPVADAPPATNDINAYRAARIRASRNDRRGKFIGRSLLSFILVGGLLAAALIFGRSYLFTTQWDPRLTPVVDRIEIERAADFTASVPLSEVSTAEYGALVTRSVLGDGWIERLPEWRALGLAGGDGAVDDVELRFATLYPAYYDTIDRTIYVAAGATQQSVDPALRLALESVYASQIADAEPVATTTPAPTTPDSEAVPATPAPTTVDGERTPLLTGVDDIDDIARRAIDAEIAGLAGTAGGALAELSGLPIPAAYRLRAIDTLGEPMLADGVGGLIGGELPPAADALADRATLASPIQMRPGDRELRSAVALGQDDWTLIWGARISADTAASLARSIVADSYVPFDRAGVTCFAARLETASELTAQSLTAGLQSWVAASPATAQALVQQVGTNAVQLEACDPGADLAVAPNVAVVDALLTDQIRRIGT